MLAWSEMRRRARGTVVLVMLVGVVGAIVLATAAGARRSESALRRFNAYSRSASVELNVGTPTTAQLDAFSRSPGVAAVAELNAYPLLVPGQTSLPVAAPVDDRFDRAVDRSRLVAGRRQNPNDPNEVTIGEGLAERLHLGPGDILEAGSLTPAQLEALFSQRDPGAAAGPALHLRVVGIVRRPLDLGDRAAVGGIVVLSPAFTRVYGGRVALYSKILRVRTAHGNADVAQVASSARRIFGHSSVFQVQPLNIETEGASDAINVLARALWIFAIVVGVAGLVVIAIVLTRTAAHVAINQPTLRALGLTRVQRIAIGGPQAIVVAGGGALLAIAAAILASPLFPVGLARRADPDPGLHADWYVLLLGFATTVAVVFVLWLYAAVRATRPARVDRSQARRLRAPTVVERVSESGLQPTVANGLRIAFQPESGPTTVRVRPAFVGAALGVLGVIAVMVFAASLDHLVATPRLYGWTFAFRVEDTNVYPTTLAMCPRGDFGLTAVGGIGDVATVCNTSVQVERHPVAGWGFAHVRGVIDPEIVKGRAPSSSDEVALGDVTLRAIHKHLGDTVRISGGGRSANFTVVGQTVLPSLSSGARSRLPTAPRSPTPARRASSTRSARPVTSLVASRTTATTRRPSNASRPCRSVHRGSACGLIRGSNADSRSHRRSIAFARSTGCCRRSPACSPRWRCSRSDTHSSRRSDTGDASSRC
jgi:hypothetical protein